jgi:dolichyl-phosphate beta-glucosyltransferase
MLGVAVAAAARLQTSLTVIIPAYNERERLPATLDASLAYLQTADRAWELIVVDDGSEDGTGAWAASQHPDESRLRVLRAPVNCGKGAALAAGASRARHERLLFMDADGGTPLTALPPLEEVMDASSGCGVVVGSRVGGASRPWLRRIMGYVFAALTATCIPGVPDTQCGFKLLSRRAAAATMPHLRVRRWAYDVELLFLARRLGICVASCPVPAVDVAGSKITWATPLQMLLDVVRVSVLYRIGVWSLPPTDAAGSSSVQRYVEVRQRATEDELGPAQPSGS